MRAKLISLDLAQDFWGLAPGSPPTKGIWKPPGFLELGIRTQLTPRQRECVRLYYYQGLTLVRAGERLGVAPSVVCRHLQKARKRLRAFLELAGQVRRKAG